MERSIATRREGSEAPVALRVRVRGIVQGVGFRPFVYRLAREHRLNGWVLNGENGVEIHLEGPRASLKGFLADLEGQPPPAARIASVVATPVPFEGFEAFTIRESEKADRPTARVSPDLAVCAACLADLFDPADRRYHYPYVNCTDCGPRYSIIRSLPYDRPRTTMRDWAMCSDCAGEYHDPSDRRFHAQPVACPRCGPAYQLVTGGELSLLNPPGPSRITAVGADPRVCPAPSSAGAAPDPATRRADTGVCPFPSVRPSPLIAPDIRSSDVAIETAAAWLRQGKVLAVKGIGGYHLAADAGQAETVRALRERKFRKEKAFALMARDLETARELIELDPAGEALLASPARPILVAPARVELPGVAPDNRDLGVMLPYTPLHYLLFAAGAPPVLVMTSANRSDEPIAYEDDDAFARLAGLADAFLVGERPIARRVDDSIVRVGPFGPLVLRRARGYAPGAVASFPVPPGARRPILAVGADLKSAITLVVDGQAFVSQHLGDLEHLATAQAFQETIRDLGAMYEVAPEDLLVVHDLHPEYVSTRFAREQSGPRLAVQHHRAHVASVLAERGALDARVIGFAFDGTGYGDDGSIWGGEVFVGSVRDGLDRAAHLRPARLPGGDAAARFPVQAAAGFLAQLPGLPDLQAPPFGFPDRYHQAVQLVERNLRSFPTTSMGRLFDTVAALVGFTRPTTFEGQAAIWLEHLARAAPTVALYPFPFADGELDFRPLLDAVIADRQRGRQPAEIARAFHEAVARAILDTSLSLSAATGISTVVLSGGVFQNLLILERVRVAFEPHPRLQLWLNREVPPNDGGISLGQAAFGSLLRC